MIEGASVVKHMWTVQKILRNPSPDQEKLCSGLVGVASALGRVFNTIARCSARLAVCNRKKSSSFDHQTVKTDFSHSLSACARAFSVLLVGLDTFNDDTPGYHLPGMVIYQCVRMFSSGLDAIGALAIQMVSIKSQTRPNTGSHPLSATEREEPFAGLSIAHMLASLLGLLDSSKTLHQRLFDGFAFVLLERVGKQLYFCTFGRHRGVTIEEDIQLTPKRTHPLHLHHEEKKALAIKLEAKALVIVLERAIGLAPKHMNNQQPSRAPKAANRNRSASVKPSPASRSRLNPLAKERLQRTLMKCMFGDKTDDEFLDVLTAPAKMGSVPTLPKMKESEIDEWYQRKVWKLVGWDVLAKDTEFNN
jgi:hypothetical protein